VCVGMLNCHWKIARMCICYKGYVNGMCTHLRGYVAFVMGAWLMFEGIVACTLLQVRAIIECYEEVGISFLKFNECWLGSDIVVCVLD